MAKHDLQFLKVQATVPVSISLTANISSRKDLDDLILSHVQNNFEGHVTEHGFVKPGSVDLVDRTVGRVSSETLDGSIHFEVVVSMMAYYPAKNDILTCRIEKFNRTAGVCYCICNDPVSAKPVIGIIVQNIQAAEVGQEINVKIVAFDVELMSDKIHAVGTKV